jgi:hypothetical protein
MASYRIVCVDTERPHRHIEQVGTADYLEQPVRLWTVTDVRAALVRGDTFHTESLSTGTRAEVHEDMCAADRCAAWTLRSAPDAMADNNLDNMSPCTFSG